jgi:hypothetical protein
VATPKEILNVLDPTTFSVVDDSVWNLVQPWVELAITSTAYGDNMDQARAYWVGHLLTVGGQVSSGASGGGSAQVSSMTVGNVSVGYATAKSSGFNDEWLGQSKWGRLLAGLSVQYVGLHMFLT